MLSKFFLLMVFCILISTKSLNALKCYECDNCLSESGDIEDCSGSENVCVKFTFGSRIAKSCKNDRICSLQSFEKGVNDAWDKMKNVFTGEEAGQRPDAISCCYSDYCNSGNALQNAVGAMGALFLALSLAYI